MENTQNCGIYKWTCKENGKVYIGQSVNLKNRKNCFTNFKYRYAGNLIDNARSKYNSSEYWDYEILEYCNADELDAKEIHYIELYDSTDRNKGYNIEKGGDSDNKIPIYQIDINTREIINSYNSLTEVTTNSDYKISSICSCCKQEMVYYKDYIWMYQSDYSDELVKEIQKKAIMIKSHYCSNETRNKMSEQRKGCNNPMYGKHHSEEIKDRIRKKALGRKQSEEQIAKKRKAVLQYSLDGVFIKEWESPKMAEIHFKGKKTTAIYKVLEGCKKTAYGFKWKYKDDVA